jgi:ribose/xylose/arabinose/galactoside ABC-type transport system permease subunit
MSSMTGADTKAIAAPTNWRVGFYRLLAKPDVNALAVYVLVQLLCIVGSLIYPDQFHYLSAANIGLMLKAIPILAIMAMGVGILMVAGEFDLSVGATYTFSAIVMATLVQDGMSAFVAAPIALCIGIAIGVSNGMLTLLFSLPSFIVTLGSMLFWQGMTLLYHGATSLRFRPSEAFTGLMAGTVGPIEAAFIWMIGLGLVLWLLLQHHWLGNHFFAVGGNREAALAIGINPGRTKLIAFGIAGGCAALAGIIATSRVGSVLPGEGMGLELQAIAASVIGGVALSGGTGTVLGIALGSILIYTIQDILLLLRAPGFYLQMFVGGLIIAAAAGNQLSRRFVR